MDYDQQQEWMEQNVSLLIQRAAQNGVGAYVIYGNLLAAAAGIHDELEPELRQKVHNQLAMEFDADVDDVTELMDMNQEDSDDSE